MIKREETGLSEEHYEDVKTHSGLIAQQVIARRRNLVFAEHSIAPVIGQNGSFDAVVINGDIWRASVSYELLSFSRLPDESNGDKNWVEDVDIESGVNYAVRPCIDELGNIYYYTLNGEVKRAKTIDNGATWQTEVLFTLGGIVRGIAVASGHMFIMAWNQNEMPIYVAREENNWALESSGIYWPYSISGFDAIKIADDGKPEFLIVFASDLPPIITKKPNGTTTKTTVMRKNGLVGFKYHNTRWSDHFVIEQIDDASEYQERTHSFLSSTVDEYGNPRYIISARGEDGTGSNRHDAIYYLFSADGRHWEQPWMGQFDFDDYGAKILCNGKYTYMLTQIVLYRADTTELTGSPSAAVTLDITNRIVDYSTSLTPFRTSYYTLRNDDGWLQGTMLAEDGLYSLQTKLGIWEDGEKHLVQISHELIDVIQGSQEAPDKTIQITSRDLGSLLNTSVRSASARINDTQMQGADRYVDITGTGYGGLAHTAAIDGSWSANLNWLRLKSNNSTGLATTTFKTDIWNGSIQSGLLISEQGDNQHAGLTFRVYDKDNYYAVIYDEPSGSVKLVKHEAGSEEILHTQAVSWNLNTLRYLRVTYRYQDVLVEESIDGRTWNFLFRKVIPQPYPPAFASFLDKISLSDGMAGFTGRGFSSEDSWSSEPPPFNWQLPPQPFDWHLPKDFSVMGLVNSDGYLYYTFNFRDDYPIWNRWNMGVDSEVYSYAFDAFAVDSGQAFWIVTTGVRSTTNTGKVYRITNPFDEALRSSTMQYEGFGWGAFAQDPVSRNVGRVMDASFSEPGFIAVATHYAFNGTYVVHSLDGGQTWSNEIMVTPYIETQKWYELNPSFQITSKAPGELYVGALKFTGAGQEGMGGLYKASDYGNTFSLVQNLDYDFGFGCGEGTDIPFSGNPNNEIFYHTKRVAYLTYHNRYYMYRSNGMQKTDITPVIDGSNYARPLPRGGLVSCLSAPNVVLAVLSGDGPEESESRRGVFYSNSYGEPWSLIVPPPCDFRRGAISGSDGSELFLFGANGAITYSSDAGQTLIDKRGDISKFGSIGQHIAILGG